MLPLWYHKFVFDICKLQESFCPISSLYRVCLTVLIRPEGTPAFQLSSHPGISLQAMMHKAKSRRKISKLVGLMLILRGGGKPSNPTEFRLAGA